MTITSQTLVEQLHKNKFSKLVKKQTLKQMYSWFGYWEVGVHGNCWLVFVTWQAIYQTAACLKSIIWWLYQQCIGCITQCLSIWFTVYPVRSFYMRTLSDTNVFCYELQPFRTFLSLENLTDTIRIRTIWCAYEHLLTNFFLYNPF